MSIIAAILIGAAFARLVHLEVQHGREGFVAVELISMFCLLLILGGFKA